MRMSRMTQTNFSKNIKKLSQSYSIVNRDTNPRRLLRNIKQTVNIKHTGTYTHKLDCRWSIVFGRFSLEIEVCKSKKFSWVLIVFRKNIYWTLEYTKMMAGWLMKIIIFLYIHSTKKNNNIIYKIKCYVFEFW